MWAHFLIPSHKTPPSTSIVFVSFSNEPATPPLLYSPASHHHQSDAILNKKEPTSKVGVSLANINYKSHNLVRDLGFSHLVLSLLYVGNCRKLNHGSRRWELGFLKHQFLFLFVGKNFGNGEDGFLGF